MKRGALLEACGAAGLLLLYPRGLAARSEFRRRRPGDPDWPSASAWKTLNREVSGGLIDVRFPLNDFSRLRNPFYIGDQPGLTQTLGWVDAWKSSPSVYAVAAKSSHDIAAAVNFARQHDLRLVIKGGGHSYQGTSNAPDSLLIWTRHMNGIGIESDAVTLGAGTIWLHAYDAVTTKAGRYVQGGGCTTVGVAGLVQSGGFGSFSKRYGSAAASLLNAEIVTADGNVRMTNAQTNPDLFWALKGGGGGSFGVVSNLTLLLHQLPEFFGAASGTIRASSDQAFARLLRQFVSFYRDSLFNEHWGESVTIRSDNTFSIGMVGQGLDPAQTTAVWKPFFDWVARSPRDYSFDQPPSTPAIPAQNWWNEAFFLQNAPGAISVDPRPGHGKDWWWRGDSDQVGQFLYGYESLWLPASLLEDSAQPQLANALFAASRHFGFALHFNKGLAGAPADAIAATRDTATNPAVLTAFALAISADGEGPAYPGVAPHEPNVTAGRISVRSIDRCMNELRALVPQPGAYVSESNYFQTDWRQAYWGSNYARLLGIKKKYDPGGLFYVHHGVGSEEWTDDGFTRRS